MSTNNPISKEDLALFALQLLPEGEAAVVREHLRENAAGRAELAALQGDLALYALGVESVEPPTAARERLLRKVSQETLPSRSTSNNPAAVDQPGNVLAFPSPRAENRSRNRVTIWSGWAVAAGFALAAALQLHQHRQSQGELESTRAQLDSLQHQAAVSQSVLSTLTDPAALNVSLQQPAPLGAELPRTPKGHAAYLPDRGALVFVATDLQPLKPYKVYELWLLPGEKGKAPVPAASFRPDGSGNAHVVLPTGPRLISVGGFGVTVEDGNSAPSKPTLPILLMGSSKT